MTTILASSKPALPADGDADPFVTSTSQPHYRFSNFDQQLFALGPGSSPSQAKRALEAHLAETERRMEEAGKLGTALVHQRKELTERLKEVENLQAEGELNPNLRQKLFEIEKDYNDVARETARAFLPKQRVPSNEAAAGSPYVPEGKGGRRSVSPSKFESQATSSPTKLSVPNRKLRNQPANRIHDIEFAAEISTSLIQQVRNLQALLAEKEEDLRETKADKSKLEIETEGLQQRLKSLDESEHRYKDENWNLETQIHELIATQKDAADREKRMTQSLNILQAEKNTAQRELDEVKLTHSKLAEEHAQTVKHHDIELGTAKRTMATAENERAAMQRKIEDLTSQNQELAKAFSSQRGRALDREAMPSTSDDDFETGTENITPEHSPPPSPIKGTPRHSVLESETLKTSLHHAQRTIQSQRTQLHREKTEKLELKRMLQDLRDELEKSRKDGPSANRRNKKMESKEFKKPPTLLGGFRSSRDEIYLDDPEWEDQENQNGAGPRRSPTDPAARGAESADQFETANETSDAAFETANEKATETEDFQTGAEELTGSDDAQTETESPSKGAGRIRRPPSLPMGLKNAGNRQSFLSTASTSNDEEDLAELKTPTAVQAPQKMRLRISRGLLSRRSRQASEDPTFQSSPASFADSSAAGTPQQAGQSLFAELADLDGSDDESYGGTPSRMALASSVSGSAAKSRASPTTAPLLPKLVMVDSGIMTDPAVQTSVEFVPKPAMTDSGVMTELQEPATQGVPSFGAASDLPMSRDSTITSGTHMPTSQWLTPEDGADAATSRPLSALSYSDSGAQHDPDMEENLAKFPVPPTSSKISPPVLGMSAIISEAIEPRIAPVLPPRAPALSLSQIRSEALEPRVQPVRPLPTPVLRYSKIFSEHVEPRTGPKKQPPSLALSSIFSQTVEPVAAPPTEKPLPRFGFSAIKSIETTPELPRGPKRDAFILPRDNDSPFQETDKPQTSTGALFGSVLGWARGKTAPTPVIAEDETRQSPRDTPQPETPESQRPFKEMSVNSNVRPARPVRVPTSDSSAQTALTADALDQLMKARQRPHDYSHERTISLGSSMGTPGTVRIRRSEDSTRSPGQSKVKLAGAAVDSFQDHGQSKRPGSSSSTRASLQDAPPLPSNHMQAIEAARTGSASGGQGTIGTMGPPLWPASAFKNRPRTPSGPHPTSPVSGKGTPTPRAAGTVSAPGIAEVQSLTKITHRSRQSSVSSFASEIDSRFNIHGAGMGMDPTGFGPNTDPRMIQAITQTMIGEYLWKYTRKTGRGDMSENRHRRYFWVHPYTRTLYWSDRDPTTAGRAQLRAKSVPIEAVRVVTDDNPMPPGLHRKSLVIISPGRTVKFTCTTGQRHETWFNALSYLLLRTNDEGQSDVEEMAGNMSHEDVQEFNPQFGRRHGTGTRPRPPVSLSSYNSRATRNEASAMAMSMEIPTLTPTPHKNARSHRSSTGTLTRLSGYWKPREVLSGTFSSLRSRTSVGAHTPGIYDASEAHDSAEDLRLMIEQQDRESDRLENVRACCDGKHDVGTLTHGSKRGHVHHGHSHAGPSTASTPSNTARSRV